MSDNSKNQTPRNIMNKLNYYKRLLKIGKLTEKQEKKYNEYLTQYNAMTDKTNKPLTEEEKKEHFKAYFETNKARALARYHRLKKVNDNN